MIVMTKWVVVTHVKKGLKDLLVVTRKLNVDCLPHPVTSCLLLPLSGRILQFDITLLVVYSNSGSTGCFRAITYDRPLLVREYGFLCLFSVGHCIPMHIHISYSSIILISI